MHVLCINEKWTKPECSKNKPSPICGNEYVVSDVAYVPPGSHIHDVRLTPGIYYRLVGFEPNRGFHESHFATLPEASAEQMESEVKEGIVNLEHA